MNGTDPVPREQGRPLRSDADGIVETTAVGSGEITADLDQKLETGRARLRVAEQ